MLIILLFQNYSCWGLFVVSFLGEVFVKVLVALSVSPSCPVERKLFRAFSYIVVLGVPFTVVNNYKNENYQEGDY